MTQATMDEEKRYWEKWIQSRDAQAGDMLMKKYLPLVRYHVGRISIGLPKNVDKEDLLSLGMYGLYDALEKYDPKRDLKFDTYATFRIRGAILDGLRKEDWLPRSSREKAKKVEAMIEKLEQKYLRNVTPDEVAKELNMTTEEVIQVVNENFFSNVLSIDEHLHDQEDGENVKILIKDEKTKTPEELILENELFEQLSELISQLNEKEQMVISLFYKEGLTLTEIGQVLGLSTSRISQIHSRALFKLKSVLEKLLT
ncbi:FliA/WhiG family RNA polymerase sigma factor [Bacillus alveayuensis]|jgi:RNA polymerase sigma factor FliA|uniref:RNA polymerase sigma factor for flagellar operon FliA n=1 Tax=Aeribacillus alveayuensis TaxID=279215 RepID=A0ABT9VLY1_9BACI|nr:FliA/WhiG family RNA polymerase sigma factor [Bacillus alveayuensis]MDQ0161760.1 RNA polymerase sigma factor for flagellar operon FliA [Bacillus alveayuensis]